METKETDVDTQLAIALYEDGLTAAKIAERTCKSLQEIAALLDERPLEVEAIPVLRDKQHNRILRRVRAMADALTLQYLERLQDTIDSPESTEKQKAAAFEEMEKVLKIAKQYSDRLLLAEGKTTENIGIAGNALPFNVMFTKTYEQPASSDQLPANNETTDGTE